MTESCSTVWIDPILFICPSIDGHLACFYLWVVVNSAASALFVIVCCNLEMNLLNGLANVIGAYCRYVD